jgi:hypothetical protein
MVGVEMRNVLRSCWSVSSNLLRHLQLQSNGRLIKLPMSLITDEFAFSLAMDGWNYYCALLEEYEKNPGVALEATQYFRFFQHEQVRLIRWLDDILFLHSPAQRSSPDGSRFYLGTWPWGGMTAADSQVGGTPFGWYYDRVEGSMTKEKWGYGRNLWYEPGDRYTLEFEWALTIQHYHALKRGYFPLLHQGVPGVTLLVRRDGDMRGLIVDGHHRLAILSSLGYTRVTVEVMQVIEESDVDQWYYVRRGHCTRERALEIFDSFFVSTGTERIKFLDVSGGSSS